MDCMEHVHKTLTPDEVKALIEEYFGVKITWMSQFHYCCGQIKFKDDSWVTETCGCRTISDNEIARIFFGDWDNYSYKGIFRREGLLVFSNQLDFSRFILKIHPENTHRTICY